MTAPVKNIQCAPLLGQDIHCVVSLSVMIAFMRSFITYSDGSGEPLNIWDSAALSLKETLFVIEAAVATSIAPLVFGLFALSSALSQ